MQRGQELGEGRASSVGGAQAQLTTALDGAGEACARAWTSPEKSPALEDSRKMLCPPPIPCLRSESCIGAFGDPAQLLASREPWDSPYPLQSGLQPRPLAGPVQAWAQRPVLRGWATPARGCVVFEGLNCLRKAGQSLCPVNNRAQQGPPAILTSEMSPVSLLRALPRQFLPRTAPFPHLHPVPFSVGGCEAWLAGVCSWASAGLWGVSFGLYGNF